MTKRVLITCFALVTWVTMAFGQSKGLPVAKTEVWDFGAAALDTSIYINRLDSATINSWYAVIVSPGSRNNVLPGFTAGILSFTAGSNDRLRTTNTKLTRYDENIASVSYYTGRVYVNAGASLARYLNLVLNEDDEITLVEKTDAGGKITFKYNDNPALQTDVFPVTANLDTLFFVAKNAGNYRIYDAQGKPSYYRVYRKAADYVTLQGTIDTTNAPGHPATYNVTFTNAAGKTWTTAVAADTFDVTLPAGYTYTLKVTDASGYIISNIKTFVVTKESSSINLNLLKCELYNVSGSITGLDSAQISKMTLLFASDTAAHKIYVPEAVATAGANTYTVPLEPNCTYVVSALGVNDYFIPKDTIRIGTADSTITIAFEAKAVHKVTVNPTGLSAEQLAKLKLTFTNLSEPGYAYAFTDLANINLRDAVYIVSSSGLDDYPVQMALTSNLGVQGKDTSKTLVYEPVTVWSFEDKTIVNGTASYKGLKFTGNIYNEILKGHLAAKPGAAIQVPVNPGERILVTYYSSAGFSIAGGDTITTASGSTSLLEYTSYPYDSATAGYVTINITADATTSYFPEIAVSTNVAFSPVIHVGTNKEYKTINEALKAITFMERPDNERVTVMIDPGNYEEMLVVNSPNVTLKNASATPSIDLANRGTDIHYNAVRITSYYGHGYSYYSMANNQKWDAAVLSVNKENGYLSYENAGSGTTNGSYWNASVVVFGSGFEAENIIFENSFNQYISRKESQDVVVMWAAGSKGLRPKDIGNTSVQDRSFVERGCALAFAATADKAVLRECRIVGRQDALYGSEGARLAMYKGVVMGAVDFIFGGMKAVFYRTNLVMNTSDVSSDAAYITAAQQKSGRGFLMYKCFVKSAIPSIDNASSGSSKPGYFGRPWQPVTSEVVFYNTRVDTCDYPGYEGASLISPSGWESSLSGESNKMYEYKTYEISEDNNIANRVSWATQLDTVVIDDTVQVTPFEFLKGDDNWNPLPEEPDQVSFPELVTFAQPAGTELVTISSTVTWTISSNQEWLGLGLNRGIDTTTFYLIALTGNPSTTPREAVVTVQAAGLAAQTFTVRQEGVPVVLSASTGSISASAAASNDLTFDITSNTAWSIASNQTWLTVDPASGEGNASITLHLTENADLTERVAVLTITGTGATNVTVNVTQDPGTSGFMDKKNSQLQLFPNPASSSLTLKDVGVGSVIGIYSLDGKMIISKTAESNVETIDVRNLENGIYIIRLLKEDQVIIHSFVKQ